MKLEYIDLSSSSSCSTQLRLSFSVKLSWERSTQLNRVESDSRFNSVNLMNWLEFDCRSTFYQILYQSDQTLYQTFYQTFYHVLYHISHHISHYISHYILYHILYYTFYHISHHIFIIFLTIFSIIFFINLSIKFSIKLIAKLIAKKNLEKKRKSILYLVTKIKFKQLNSILNWARVEKSQLNLNLNSKLSWVNLSQLNSTLT